MIKEIMTFIKSHVSWFHSWLPLNLSVSDTQNKNDWGLFKHQNLKLELHKFTFNANNFRCMLSLSISSHIGAIHSLNVLRSLKRKTY